MYSLKKYLKALIVHFTSPAINTRLESMLQLLSGIGSIPVNYIKVYMLLVVTFMYVYKCVATMCQITNFSYLVYRMHWMPLLVDVSLACSCAMKQGRLRVQTTGSNMCLHRTSLSCHRQIAGNCLKISQGYRQ